MVISFETDEQGFKNINIPKPKGLEVEKGAELRIIKEWLSAGIPGLLFALLMFGGWGVFFAIKGELFCIIPMFILFGLNALYYLLVFGAANTTEIKVSQDQLTVENSVQVWNNKKLTSTNIAQLYCQRVRNWGRRNVWGSDYNYNVIAITKDGQNVSLIKGLHEPVEAVYIEQEIEHFLGIENQPVPGEFQYL